VELRDYLRILRKRWIIIVVLTLVGVAAAAAASILTTPEYEASTIVFVSVQSDTNVQDLASGNNFTQGQVKSYAEAVSTPLVLDPVIRRLNLNESAAKLALSVTGTSELDTVNITITATDPSPTRAANIANAVTESFRTTIAQITKPASGHTSPVSASVLQPATVPTDPTSPNTKLDIALGLLVGLAIGVGLAVLIDVLDTRIRGKRDVTLITNAPIIGGIALDPNAVTRPLIVQDDPHSPRAESFRILRTNLQFLEVEPGPKSFVMTSAVPGEGKTTTSANLAITIAESGAKVVILDADLRRPKLAEYLGLEGGVGLSDVLIGRVPLADALQPWGRGTLNVLPAGSIPPNPSELLGSTAMAALLRTLETQFDVVIIDLPPLLPVTDAALVSKLTRGTLVVVAAGNTHKGEFAAAISALENVGANVAGVIITMLPTKGPDAYGYGRYGYGRYGYGGYSSSVTTTPAANSQFNQAR
jgi:capsular exopolysaccharide synthesis family protein